MGGQFCCFRAKEALAGIRIGGRVARGRNGVVNCWCLSLGDFGQSRRCNYLSRVALMPTDLIEIICSHRIPAIVISMAIEDAYEVH